MVPVGVRRRITEPWVTNEIPSFAGRHQRLLGRPRIPPRGRAPDPLFGPLQRGLRSTPEQRFEDMGALLDALGPPNRR